MAGANEDFLIGDDFDAVLALIDHGFLENDRELNQQVNEIVSEIGNHDTKQVFKCETCQKVCVSQRGLTRHQNAKHNSSASATDIKNKPSTPQSTCNALKYVEISVKKLALDECHPEDITSVSEIYWSS